MISEKSFRICGSEGKQKVIEGCIPVHKSETVRR